TIACNFIHPTLDELFSDALTSDLVQLVQRDQRGVVLLQRHSCDRENSRQRFTMIEAHTKIAETEFRQHFTRSAANLRFNDHRARAEHVDVALVKLAKPS